MQNRITVVFILSLFGLIGCDNAPKKEVEPTRGYLSWDHLIDAENLKAQLENPHFKFIDLRSAKKFGYGHLPNAFNISMLSLEDTSYLYSGVMASKAEMENLLSGFGINSTDTLIAYDAISGVNAARLWWILKVYGFNNVMILNGGDRAWRAADGAWTESLSDFSLSDFHFPSKGDSSILAVEKDLKPILYQGEIALLDTREMDEYTGHSSSEGALYKGHIQSSRNFSWNDLVNMNGDRKIKSVVGLDTVLMSGMLQLDQEIFVYSNTGKSAAFVTFVLTELAGCTNVKNYDGGWVEWSHLNEEIKPNME